MVFSGETLRIVVPAMAPTTRSARRSIEPQTFSPKMSSFSSTIVTAETSVCKVESRQEEVSLRVYKSRYVNEKSDGALQRNVVARARKREKKSLVVEAVESGATDMEDLCAMEGLQDEQPKFSQLEAEVIRTNVLAWYDKNHRELPWRVNTHSCLSPPSSAGDSDDHRKLPSRMEAKKEEASQLEDLRGASAHAANAVTETEGERAYAVWVSEMMLQQTRVATVIRYYQSWMSTWPTVHALAQASQEAVNTIWAGLGYYRRARFLLEGAKYIVQDLGGKFPESVEELRKVPGIGSYTAGAIASIAFNQAVPVVDGNVIRVLCRLRAISLNPKTSTAVKLFWSLASQLVDENRPGDLNQALMELGATVCTPTSPLCTSCPVSTNCAALKLVHHREKKLPSVTCFPMKVPKSAPRDEYVAVCIVERESQTKMTDSSLLLVQRPLKGILAGLWEFPSAPLENPDSSEKSRATAVDAYLQEQLGVALRRGRSSVLKREEFGTYVHIFSHIRLHMYIQWVLLRAEEVEGRGTTSRMPSSVVTKWVDSDSMSSLGLTSGVKKVYEMFSAYRGKQLMGSVSTKRKRTNFV